MRFHRQIEHRKLHPAGNIDADRVRNHRVLAGQHAADRQAVADVRIRHQRGADRIRHLAGMPHLLVRTGVDVGAPGAVTDRLVANRRRLRHQLPSKLTPNRVGLVRPRIANNSRHKLPRPLPLHPHPGPLLRGPRKRLNRRLRTIRRHTKFLKLLAVHRANRPCQVRPQSLCTRRALSQDNANVPLGSLPTKARTSARPTASLKLAEIPAIFV